MRSVINVTQVFEIEREPWGSANILIVVNYGVYKCTCLVIRDEYMCNTRHAFVYDSHVKPLHQWKCCGDLIDNRSDEHFCVLEKKGIQKMLKLRHALKFVLQDC